MTLVRARVVPRREAQLRDRLSRYFLGMTRRLAPGFVRLAPVVDERTKARDPRLLEAVEVIMRSLSWDAEARILRTVLRPAYEVLGDDAIAAVGSELGIGTAFDLNARQLSAIRADLSRRVVGITERSRELLSGRIVDGIEKGLSLRQIVNGVPPGTTNVRGPVPAFGGIKGLVDSWASTGTGRILGPVLPRGHPDFRPLRSTRAYLIAQTETANAFNRSALAGYQASGIVDFVEVFDGPDCGWETHDSPDLAHGSIRKLSDAQKHPISHPRCQRAFGASLAATGARPSPYQGRPISDVPGATPGLRPGDAQPFSGRLVPTAPGARGPGAASPTPRPAPSLSPAEKRARAIENNSERIRGIPTHEEAFAVADDGTIVLDKTGRASNVDFDQAEVRKLRGTTLTHNHPEASRNAEYLHSTSFSPDDIRMYYSAELREIRAVGRGRDYVFSSPKDLGPAVTGAHRQVWLDVQREVQAIVTQRITAASAAASRGPGLGLDMAAFAKARAAIIAEAQTLHAHRVMLRLKARFPGIDYREIVR